MFQLRTVAMATFVLQHVSHLERRHLAGFFKNLIFSKTAANFLEIDRKYVFTASNRNIIKNRELKKKFDFLKKKLQFSFSHFNLHN